ncbi:MAG: zinc dependent phospholipase C family protein [Gemmatimonadetes bacterium]|nr:zinc dependent phospholipase C family protein [Gemmatimonadota bacterium]
MRRGVLLLAAAVLLVALLPSDGWAWSPGTHIFLGHSVLANLPLLPGAVADLLRAYPMDFLYGSIAADTSFAKKYAPVGRHSHAWHVGQEIAELAGSAPLRAFGLGYLAHLAADVVAHNFFVPRRLVLTSSTRALGHSYWEARFDMHLGERYAKRAREVIGCDHSASDEHLDRILSPTIFSVRTNRRLFRGMVQLTDLAQWQRVVQLAAEASRWDLPDYEVERHMATSFDFVMDFFIAGDTAKALRFDPSGTDALAAAKRMRRHALRSGGRRDQERVADVAEEHFGLPRTSLGYWDRYDIEPKWRRVSPKRRKPRALM